MSSALSSRLLYETEHPRVHEGVVKLWRHNSGQAYLVEPTKAQPVCEIRIDAHYRPVAIFAMTGANKKERKTISAFCAKHGLLDHIELTTAGAN